MEELAIWEGRRGPTKMLQRGSKTRRSRRTAFELRRKKVFIGGTDRGSGVKGTPFAHQRGCEYRIFRSESGEIIIHRGAVVHTDCS